MIRPLILALALAVPLAAQDAPLFIERIEVRNHKRVSPDVVIAESRLHQGRAYSEAELRDAATRLSRLPFLLSVDFSLEKGSERGRHVLVLTINETKPFFFLIDAVPYFDEDPYVEIDYDDRPGAADEDLVVGFRWFVGRRGAVHVGFSGAREDRPFTNEYASVVAGYTQYDLFGTRAFATLNLKRPIEGSNDGKISPQLVLGVPLSPNQTVTLEYDESRFERLGHGIEGERIEGRSRDRILSARWSYNTTNEPFFPTHGTLLTLAPHYAKADGVNRYWDTGADPRDQPFHSYTYGVSASATRFFELSERSSVWGDVRGEWAEVDHDYETDFYDVAASSGGVGAGYAFSLWSREERAHGDSRFELTARYSYRVDPEQDSVFHHDRNVVQASASWVRRTSWGTLRLGVGYAW